MWSMTGRPSGGSCGSFGWSAGAGQRKRQWREYYHSLRLLYEQIGDVAKTDLGRKFREDIPHPWKLKLAVEEDKKVDHESVILVRFPDDVKKEEVMEMVEVKTGTTPRDFAAHRSQVPRDPANDRHWSAIKIA